MLNTGIPQDADNTAALFAKIFQNAIEGSVQDDNATIATGLVAGKVVKYSSANSRWELCDGTVTPATNDLFGILTYVDTTTLTKGQVKLFGVYIQGAVTLAANTVYYCQANGTIGTTVTNVKLGKTTTAGRLSLTVNGGTADWNTMINKPTIPSPGLGGVQTFTASGTFVVPAGVTKVYVSGCGGGGSGGGGNYYGGGGGGAGACAYNTPVTVTPGQNITVTIGAGGVANTGTGGAGGVTSFGALLSLSGGGAGVGGTNQNNAGGASGGSYASAGAYNVTAPGVLAGGSGGSNIYGVGGISKVSSPASDIRHNGTNGSGWGGGGGGFTADAQGGSTSIGGNGSPGFLSIVW